MGVGTAQNAVRLLPPFEAGSAEREADPHNLRKLGIGGEKEGIQGGKIRPSRLASILKNKKIPRCPRGLKPPLIRRVRETT